MSGLVSVVVPAHNASATVEETLRSALQRDVGEVLVIDDGSSDATSDIVAKMAAHDARIQLVRNEVAVGPARARNQGLAAASGDFLLFLDSDDTLRDGAVATLLGAVTPTSAAVLGRFEAIDAAGQPLDIGTWATVQLQPVLRRHGQFVPTPRLDGEALLTRLVVPPPGGILVRRSAALAVGGYNESLGRSEDIAFLVALVRQGELTMVRETVVRYRRDPKQRSQATTARRRGRQRALASIIWSGATRSERRALARGAMAHHLDRASVRWRAGTKGPKDLAVAGRSVLLAGGFWLVGAIRR